MKKTWIIISIVILVIALLAGAWWYLLMNGRPEGLSAIPNPFGSSTDVDFSTTPDIVEEPRPPGTSLRKLSVSPVAGAVIFSHDGAEYIRYVERGTGHIFEVDPASGATKRISGATIPRAIKAIWSPQGSRVVLITEAAGGAPEGTHRAFAATIERVDEGEDTLNRTELPSDAYNIAFSGTGESLYYTTATAAGSIGYEHNLKTGGRSVRFNSVLRDLVVVWGSEANASLRLLAYTTPTAELRGYAYEGESFARLLGGITGLMLIPISDHVIVSYAENNTLVSRADSMNGIVLGIPMFPEKCVADPTRSATVWCGAPSALPSGLYPDAWYQGAVSFTDDIWRVDMAQGTAMHISIPTKDAGEAIDVTDMQIGAAGDMLLFINKKDGALWMQEIE